MLEGMLPAAPEDSEGLFLLESLRLLAASFL
jgi:hypothetical protein